MTTKNYVKKRKVIHFLDDLWYDDILIKDEHYMGRKKLNRTREELLEQQRARAKRYYNKHRSRLNVERMQRYWTRTNKSVS